MLLLSFFQQLHILFEHVPVVAKRGYGLGVLNEAASESVHRDFSFKWKDYEVLNIDNPLYKKRLLNAVQSYNASHL